MSITASDLIIYGATGIAEDDTTQQGGGIDAEVRYVFDDSTLANTLNDTVDVVSDNAGDTTQTVTVTGRLSTGVIDTEDFTLNGASEQTGSTTFERILKVVCDAAHFGTINVEDNGTSTTILDMESGVLAVRRPFYNVASAVATGASRDYYEKVFMKNTNASFALLSASILESADPTGIITFTLEDAQDDNELIASRLNTAPTGISEAFSDDAKDVPGTNVDPASAIGVWMKMTLVAGAAAGKSTWVMNTTGSTV